MAEALEAVAPGVARSRAAAGDRALVLELSEEVLARVQEKVYDSLVNREGAL